MENRREDRRDKRREDKEEWMQDVKSDGSLRAIAKRYGLLDKEGKITMRALDILERRARSTKNTKLLKKVVAARNMMKSHNAS